MKPSLRPDRGMALIAVLWIVAALSVLVIGMTKTVRQQIRVTSAVQEEVHGQALGEAAIVLALQAIQTRSEPLRGSTSAPVAFAGVEINVEVTPLDGLISLNGAGVPLLADLLQTAGGLDAGRASTLAQAMVEWRDQRPAVDPTSPGGANVSARRFEAVEDLLLVPGFDYPLYARLRHLVTADLADGGRVNPMAAPPGVLAVLAGGNPAVVDRIIGARGAQQPGVDTSGLNAAFTGGGGGDRYRLIASVPLDAGKMLLLTRDIALGTGYSRTAPWRLLRGERQIVLPAA